MVFKVLASFMALSMGSAAVYALAPGGAHPKGKSLGEHIEDGELGKEIQKERKEEERRQVENGGSHKAGDVEKLTKRRASDVLEGAKSADFSEGHQSRRLEATDVVGVHESRAKSAAADLEREMVEIKGSEKIKRDAIKDADAAAERAMKRIQTAAKASPERRIERGTTNGVEHFQRIGEVLGSETARLVSEIRDPQTALRMQYFALALVTHVLKFNKITEANKREQELAKKQNREPKLAEADGISADVARQFVEDVVKSPEQLGKDARTNKEIYAVGDDISKTCLNMVSEAVENLAKLIRAARESGAKGVRDYIEKGLAKGAERIFGEDPEAALKHVCQIAGAGCGAFSAQIMDSCKGLFPEIFAASP